MQRWGPKISGVSRAWSGDRATSRSSSSVGDRASADIFSIVRVAVSLQRVVHRLSSGDRPRAVSASSVGHDAP